MDRFQPTYRISDALALDLMQLAQILGTHNRPINLTNLTLHDLYACCGAEHTLRNHEHATFLPTTNTLHAYPSPNTLHRHIETWLLWLKHSHPLPLPITAALSYQHLMAIRPLPDHNAMLAKNMAHLILAQGGYPGHLLTHIDQPQYQHHLIASLAQNDQSDWVAWFCHHLVEQMSQHTIDARQLTKRQRQILTLFYNQTHITSFEVGQTLGVQSRARAHICQQWVKEGFLAIGNRSNKGRTYCLTPPYQHLASSMLRQIDQRKTSNTTLL